MQPRYRASFSHKSLFLLDAANRKLLKRNERFTANASMIVKECKDLFGEKFGEFSRKHLRALKHRFNYLQIRYHIHCMTTLSLALSAQQKFLEATILEDL